jgi:hypothetical protein
MKTKEKTKLETQYKRQNEFIKENYDRVSVTLPKGTKDRILATGESVNGFISRMVAQELSKVNKQSQPPF